MPPLIFLHLFISGKVQGVFFRKYTQKAALDIGGITGMVRNLEDNVTVEVMAFSQNKESLDKFVTWCSTKGSPKSRIDGTRIEYFDEFEKGMSERKFSPEVLKALEKGNPFAVWKKDNDF